MNAGDAPSAETEGNIEINKIKKAKNKKLFLVKIRKENFMQIT